MLIAVSTGMRSAEIHRLRWSDVMYSEGLLAVRAKLKKGKVRYVPMPSELAAEVRCYPAVIDEDRIFPPNRGDKSGRHRLEGSFDDLLVRAKILGHSNIKMTERYAKLGREHITKTGTTAKVIWSLMKKKPEHEEGDQQDVA